MNIFNIHISNLVDEICEANGLRHSKADTPRLNGAPKLCFTLLLRYAHYFNHLRVYISLQFLPILLEN